MELMSQVNSALSNVPLKVSGGNFTRPCARSEHQELNSAQGWASSRPTIARIKPTHARNAS
jgi:hypothetical protein